MMITEVTDYEYRKKAKPKFLILDNPISELATTTAILKPSESKPVQVTS